MKLLILSVCLAAAAAAPSNLWQVFQASYAKVYTPQEEAFRKQIFQEQLEFVSKHNQEADKGLHTYRVGINEFSDWTQEEYESLLLGYKEETDAPVYHEQIGDQPIPADVDWRSSGKVTGIKNQGSCGSCWSFAAVGALETACAVKGQKLTPLSEQQMIDCSKSYGNNGCRGGSHHKALDYIKDCGGSVREDCYRYIARDTQQCKFESVRHCIECKSTGKVRANGEAALARENAIGAVTVGVDASRSGFRNYRSGVYRDSGCSKSRGNHAMVSVGFGSNFWIIKNSWGSSWGSRGFINMYRGDNNCGIGNSASRPNV